jgi:hypothetical protein
LKPESWEAVREVQRKAAVERKNMHMVPAIDVLNSDLVHLDAEGQPRWARRLAEAALSEVYHRPAHGRPIRLESIKIVGRETPEPAIHLHFSGVSGRLKCEGRPADFELRLANETPQSPSIYRTEFDPEDPAGLILHVINPLTPPAKLVYGAGSHPYCNITDEKDMGVPAFGPIDIGIIAVLP